MKSWMWLLAAALAGCCCDERNEAETLGYRGADLKDPDGRMYFSPAGGVTNWVPTRVLTVFEKYDITPDELALVKAAGTVMPSVKLESVPAGYAAKTTEPWFTTWAKPTKSFGQDGFAGFVAHSNVETRVWETGEAYFSTYHDGRAKSEEALKALEKEIAAFRPLKMHYFKDGWIAEYRRLRVMCLVGQRADGTWTCMLSLVDKCDPGCGAWESVEEQQARLSEQQYRQALKIWNTEQKRRQDGNHKEIERLRQARKVPLFGPSVAAQPTGDGRYYYVRVGAFAASNTVPEKVWAELHADVSTATRITLPNVVEAMTNETLMVWSTFQTNDLYTVRLDMMFPKAAPGSPANGEWRELVIEQTLPGFRPLPRPVRK